MTKKNINKELKSAGFPLSLRSAGMTECGRSMVEMLGVLAVIGILSVGGIAGYSNAMKKHRANEILNEASKRAVMVAAQAMTGKTGEISLGEFTQNTFSGVTFAGTANVADNKITLGLSGTGLADICAQLKNATGDNTVMKVTQDDCSELTFNADMSTGSSNNEPVATCTPACQATEECVDGTCITKADPNDSRSCAKNSDCNTWCESNKGEYDYGCYCQISASYTGTENACYNNFSGTCATINIFEKRDKRNYCYINSITWWSAKNFCKAIGSNMASQQSACNGNLGGCTSVPDYYWLSDCYGTDCTDTSCVALYVGKGYVYGGARNSSRYFNNAYFAVCE